MYVCASCMYVHVCIMKLNPLNENYRNIVTNPGM